MMTRLALLDMLTKFARNYAPQAKESIMKNRHMHECGEGITVAQEEINALLVDFIVFIGIQQGVDYALCTHDLRM